MDAQQPPEQPKQVPISQQRNPLAEENLPPRDSAGDGSSSTGFRILLIAAAVALFVVAGVQLLQIHSESGDSIAEASYHAFGFMCFGLAALSALIGTLR